MYTSHSKLKKQTGTKPSICPTINYCRTSVCILGPQRHRHHRTLIDRHFLDYEMNIRFCIVKNNVLLFKLLQKHIGHVRKVLSLFTQSRYPIEVEECWFFTKKIDFIRRVIHPQRLVIVPHKRDVLRRLITPRNITIIRSFL